MTWTQVELAALVEAEVQGDDGRSVGAVRSLEAAGAVDLSFVTGPAHRGAAEASGAGALIVPPALADLDRPRLVVQQPGLALAKILAQMVPVSRPPTGIHATAIVHEQASVDAAASVGPYAVVGAGSAIGAETVLHAHVVVGRGCRVGDRSVLHPHVVLYDDTQVGDRATIHAGSIIGSDGFGYVFDGTAHVKVPQVGSARVGSDVEIGALSSVDRAALERTEVGDGTKIDNHVQVAHNVRIGKACILCSQVGVAGTTRIGNGVVLAGQVGVADHVEVGDGAQVMAKSAVLQSVEGGGTYGGVPAVTASAWRRQVIASSKLGTMGRRLRALERRLAAIEEERG